MDSIPEKALTAQGQAFEIAEDTVATLQPTQKPRKPPPITPRRFRKFFEPRLQQARRGVRTSRSALQDITGPVLNRTKIDCGDHRASDPSFSSDDFPRKRRRLSFGSPSSSLQSSPLRRAHYPCGSQDVFDHDDRSAEALSDVGEEDETDIEMDEIRSLKPPTRRFRELSLSANRLSWRLSGRRPPRESQDSQIWQNQSTDFYTGPEDVYSSVMHNSTMLALPFCTTSCNTNSLIAIGKEDGVVRIVDSATGDKAGFSSTYLSMRPHDNAIMDLEFSSDDALLATASGDQTCQVIDMQTQRSLYCLSGHSSSTKQVRFQPGSGNNVLATSSRDGCINFWDLRCRTIDRPSFHLRSSGRVGAETDSMTDGMRYSTLVNTIREAHLLSHPRSRRPDNRPKPVAVSGRNEFSVTSLSFISPTQPHLVVTASEVDAVVKLWDMRTSYSSKKGKPVSSKPVPLSCTQEPKSHKSHRHFGLTSLALSNDGSRLYTLCRDHTVYTYATSHLVLGGAPEMSAKPSRAFRPEEHAQHGLGPMYAFRHPQLRVSTFYPKLRIRKTNNKDVELLAVGSSDDCAVVYPTNERYLTKSARVAPSQRADSAGPNLTRQNSFSRSLSHLSRPEDDIPIYYHGTPLIRGHNKEVTAVTWTSEGSLVTASDDFSVRCWRENANMAQSLRRGGEGEGKRWNCGWADVSPECDEDE